MSDPGAALVVERGDLRLATALAGLALSLYLATLCPTIYWYDSAEYVAAAVSFGIPHPPGYPLYTLVAHLFTWLPLPSAVAVNLMSAVFAALAVGLGYLLLRVLGAGAKDAAFGALMLAVAETFWSNATIAEGYTPALASLWAVLLVLVLALRLRRPGLAYVAAGLSGAFLGFHLSIATAGLGLATLCYLGGGASWQARRAHLVRCAAAAVGGACVFLLLPVRALFRPAVNHLEPLSLERFVWLVSGGNYKDWFVRGYDLPQRIADVFWQAAQDPGLPGLALGLLGLWTLRKRAGGLALSLSLVVVGNVAFFFEYDVHDLPVFLLPSTGLLCLLSGLGLKAALESLRRPALRALLGWLALCWPVARGALDFERRDRSDFGAAERYAEAVEATLPPSAVLLSYTTPAEWKYDAVFRFYYQQTLGKRRDVIVARQLGLTYVRRLLQEGRAVYLYAPVDPISQHFELVPDGPLYRLQEPR